MNSDTSPFFEIMVKSYAVDIFCLVVQFLLVIRISIFNIIQRNSYPIKQNSPLLTVACLLSLFVCNLIAFFTRTLVNEDFLINQQGVKARCCFLSDKKVYLLSFLQLFFSEIPMITYCLKLLRNLTAYYDLLFRYKILVKIMKSQVILLMISFIYCGLSLSTDLFSRLSQEDQMKQRGDIESTQTFQFFCNPPARQIDATYLGKHCFIALAFYVLYSASYKLSPKLRFGHQWFSLLLVIMLRVIAQDILEIYDISTTRPKYYLILLSNLVITMTIAFYLGSKTSVSPIPANIIDGTFMITVQQDNARISLEHFFRKSGKEHLFSAYLKTMRIKQMKYDTEKVFQEIIKKDLQKYIRSEQGKKRLTKVYIQQIQAQNYNTYGKSYQSFKFQLVRLCEEVFQDWKDTKGFLKWQKICSENSLYIQRLDTLRINI